MRLMGQKDINSPDHAAIYGSSTPSVENNYTNVTRQMNLLDNYCHDAALQ